MSGSITTTTASQTRSNLGPLTTRTWTPPAQCTYFGPGYNNVSADAFYLAQSCLWTEPHDATACWPPATTTVSNTWALFGYGYYSPGIVCPPGYTQACAQAPPFSGSLTGSLSTLKTFAFQYDQVGGETAMGCCPTGMSCTTGTQGVQTCAVVTSDISASIGLCSGNSYEYASISRISIGKSNTSFYGPLIQLIYQATDTESAFLSTLSSTSILSSTSVLSSTLVPSSTPALSSTPVLSSSALTPLSTTGVSADQNGSSGSLSNGAKIAVGVGIPLGVLLLAGLAFALLFRRRRQRQMLSVIELQDNSFNAKRNMSVAQYNSHRIPKELLSEHGTSELDSNTDAVVYELSSATNSR